MSDVNQNNNTYNNKYDINKKYSQVLFKPNKPVFQSDLNELQSILTDQLRLVGNSYLKDGAILSGLGLVSQGTIDETTEDETTEDETSTSSEVNPNILSLSGISSNNSQIDTSGWYGAGLINITPISTLSTSYPGIEMYTNVSTSGDLTISFDIKRDVGNLNNFSIDTPNGAKVTKYYIDGIAMKTKPNTTDGTVLIDTSGNQVNISDGNYHSVQITYEELSNSAIDLYLKANVGYDMLTTGSVSYTVRNLKFEDSDEPTSWELSSADVKASDNQSRNLRMLVQSGYVYLGGQVRVFDGDTIDIMGSGTEKIGLKLYEDIVTSDQDIDLSDTTKGSLSEYSTSTDRLHYTVGLTYNDPNSVPLYTLSEGKQSEGTNALDTTAQLNDILARRTNDESGSYRVSGFNFWSRKNTTDSSKVDIVIDAGTAYVQGYGVYKQVSTVIQNDKSVGTNTEIDEPLQYSKSNSNFGVLYNQPVQSVNTVSGLQQVTSEAVNRDSSSKTDKLNNSNVYTIQRIYTKSNGNVNKVYTPDNGTSGDFRLVNGKSIQWDIYSGSQQPSQGTTYYIDYDFEKVFIKGKDYQIVTTGSNDLAVTQVSFEDMNGGKPAEGTMVHINYDYFLARADMLTLDKDRNFTIIKGQEAPLSEVKPPLHQDPLTLRIGYITVYPNSDKATCQLETVTRIPFTGLQNLVSRVSNVEDSISALNLHQSAMENQDPVTLASTFSDDFSTYDKADITNEDFKVAYDNLKKAITLPIEASGAIQPSVTSSASNLHVFSHTVTAPYTEEALIQQPFATGTKNVNPYKVFNVLGQLEIDPATDNWMDTTSHQVEVDGGSYSVQRTTWSSNNYLTNSGKYAGYTGNQLASMIDGQNLNTYWGGKEGTITDTSYSQQDNTIEYARTRTINFTANTLVADTDNLVFKIDGVPCDITPAEGYSAGTKSGSIRSDSNGTAKGSIVIPENTIRTGTREVSISNDGNIATNTYVANGTLRDITETVTRTHVTLNILDPLAQSVVITEDCILSSVDLYFAGKPSDSQSKNNNLVVQLRELGDEGFPTTKVYASATLKPSDITTSSDAKSSTKVSFDNPVPVKSGDRYAITILSGSDNYEMYIAESGQRQVGSSSVLGQQPYVDGVLFESSNAQTWTVVQTQDLKFTLNKATFSDTGKIAFDTIYPKEQVYRDGNGIPYTDSDGKEIPLDISELSLLVSYLTLGNTGMNWNIKIVDESQPNNVTAENVDWQPINDGISIDMLNKSREIKLQATFKATKNLSPIVAMDSLSLGAILTSLDGSYLTRNINLSSNPYNAIRFSYEADIPQGSSVKPYISLDKGKTWKELPSTSVSSAPVDQSYTKYTYKVLLYDQSSGDNTLADSFKLRLDLHSTSAFVKPYVRRFTSAMSISDGTDTGTGKYEPVE